MNTIDYEYDLELEKVVESIKSQDAKTVVLHLPDGLKNKGAEIVDYIYENTTGVNVVIWAGSNFGACDLPVDVERAGADLIIHFGHSPWLS
jgi:2-(3-amino-3-carboxypropyl)histidine synthase